MKAVLFMFAIAAMPFAHAEKAKELEECKAIVAQCETAGFHVGDAKEGKGLWKNCVEPRSTGGEVTGVTATPEEAKKCWDASKAHRQEKKAAKKAKKAAATP